MRKIQDRKILGAKTFIVNKKPEDQIKADYIPQNYNLSEKPVEFRSFDRRKWLNNDFIF
jgi:hypothetical protein